uniref:FZ domain-containing protein n=1 Tax=Steinernema glaseri TaxID=37863 RepID=A0A1I8A195_9BILA
MAFPCLPARSNGFLCLAVPARTTHSQDICDAFWKPSLAFCILFPILLYLRLTTLVANYEILNPQFLKSKDWRREHRPLCPNLITTPCLGLCLGERPKKENKVCSKDSSHCDKRSKRGILGTDLAIVRFLNISITP